MGCTPRIYFVNWMRGGHRTRSGCGEESNDPYCGANERDLNSDHPESTGDQTCWGENSIFQNEKMFDLLCRDVYCAIRAESDEVLELASLYALQEGHPCSPRIPKSMGRWCGSLRPAEGASCKIPEDKVP